MDGVGEPWGRNGSAFLLHLRDVILPFEGLRKDLGLGPELRAVLRISNTNTVSLVFIQIAPAGESQTMWRNGDQELTFVIAVLSLSVKR